MFNTNYGIFSFQKLKYIKGSSTKGINDDKTKLPENLLNEIVQSSSKTQWNTYPNPMHDYNTLTYIQSQASIIFYSFLIL